MITSVVKTIAILCFMCARQYNLSAVHLKILKSSPITHMDFCLIQKCIHEKSDLTFDDSSRQFGKTKLSMGRIWLQKSTERIWLSERRVCRHINIDSPKPSNVWSIRLNYWNDHLNTAGLGQKSQPSKNKIVRGGRSSYPWKHLTLMATKLV